MGKIEVVNKHHRPFIGVNDFYIGRGSPLGNPYPIGPHAHRAVVIAQYEGWITDKIKANNPQVIKELNMIAGFVLRGETIRLVCFCAPKPCHGDVLKKLICDAIKD